MEVKTTPALGLIKEDEEVIAINEQEMDIKVEKWAKKP